MGVPPELLKGCAALDGGVQQELEALMMPYHILRQELEALLEEAAEEHAEDIAEVGVMVEEHAKYGSGMRCPDEHGRASTVPGRAWRADARGCNYDCD